MVISCSDRCATTTPTSGILSNEAAAPDDDARHHSEFACRTGSAPAKASVPIAESHHDAKEIAGGASLPIHLFRDQTERNRKHVPHLMLVAPGGVFTASDPGVEMENSARQRRWSSRRGIESPATPSS